MVKKEFENKRVLKKLKTYLKGLESPFKTMKGREINPKSYKWNILLEVKVERLNTTELQMFQNEVNEKGCEWGLNYLFGGLREKNHLCPTESRISREVLNDNFLTWNGVSCF